MADKLIVLADLGHLKAYRVHHDPMDSSPRVELEQDLEFTDAHGRLLDKVTDKAGRFPGMGTGGGGMSIGENHNLLLEMDRRLVKQIAERIDTLVGDLPLWHFAAPTEINGRILEALSAGARGKLKKNVTSDLTKVPKGDLLGYF